MKKYKIPIFTEEYGVIVYIGKRQELIKAGAKYTEEHEDFFGDEFTGRGLCYKGLPEKYPLIIVDGDLPIPICIATLAHEASHSMDFIAEHLKIRETNGEFHAHGISVILRIVLGDILLKVNKK